MKLTIELISSLNYLFTMIIAGAFIVIIASEITNLAKNCHTEPTHLGTVFIANGFAAVIGSLLSSYFYRKFPGDYILGISLMIVSICSFTLSSITNLISLHINYFFSGFALAFCDTGANILINKTLGSKAVGPWLIALQLGFNFGGFFAIFLEELLFLSMEVMFMSLGSILIVVGFFSLLLPLLRHHSERRAKERGSLHEDATGSNGSSNNNSTKDLIQERREVEEDVGGGEVDDEKDIQLTMKSKKSPSAVTSLKTYSKVVPFHEDVENKDEENGFPTSERTEAIQAILEATESKDLDDQNDQKSKIAPNLTMEPVHYYSEIFIGLIILFVVGSGTSATAFLQPYAMTTEIVSVRTANLQICIVWLAMTLGCAFSLVLRRSCFPKKESLPKLFFLFAGLAALGSSFMLIIPDKNQTLLWFGLILFGFFSKPCVGLAFQWITMVSYANETSFAIAYVGLNAGAGVIPYVTTALWNYLEGPDALFIVLLGSMLITIPLFLLSSYVSEKPEI